MDRDDQLELYRPDRSDPDLPGLAKLRNQLAQSAELRAKLDEILESDQCVGASLRAVETPVFLRQAVTAKLRLASEVQRRRNRRKLLYSCVGGAAAAAMLTIAILPWTWGRLTVDVVAPECVRLFQQLGDVPKDAADWGSDSDWPVGFYTNYFRGRGMVDIQGYACPAYEFANDGHRALAVMIPRRAFTWNSSPGAYGISATGGTAVAFLDSGDYVCVVVVDGDADILGVFRDEKTYI